MDHERFESITAGIQSIVTAIGIVVGAWWTWDTFRSVGTVKKAELEITGLQQSAARQPILQIDIQARPGASLQHKKARRLDVTVRLKNEGNWSLIFDTPSLAVTALPDGDGAPSTQRFNTRQDAQMANEQGRYEAMPERLLRAGQARTVAFSVPLPKGGPYLLEVRSQYAAGEFKDSHAIKGHIENGVLVETDNDLIEAIEQMSVTLD